MLKGRVIAYEVPSSHTARSLEDEPLIHVYHVSCTLSKVGALNFKERLIAFLALNLEELVIIVIEAELLAVDDVIGKRLDITILCTVEMNLCCEHFCRIGSDGAEMIHLIWTFLLTVVNSVLQVLQHVLLHCITG